MADTAAQLSFPNPYVGPVPFLEGQKLYGRVNETDALYNLLISKRIVLLFSPSGAGKTSLIQAALVPRLRSRLDPLPIIRLDRMPNVSDRPTNRYLLSAFQSLESRFPQSERLTDEQLSGQTFAGYLSQRLTLSGAKETAKFPLLVFDQFEELFTLNRFDWKEKEDFLRQLGQALGGSTARHEDEEAVDERVKTPPTWGLLSMREDYVAELEPFLELIPTGLAYRYRLEPLERNQAIEAVRGPAGEYFREDAAELLVDNLRKLRAQTPRGEEKWEEGRFVEPVHLQVVCQRLWDKIVKVEERPIALGDVVTSEHASEVDVALSAYYDRELEHAVHETGVRERDLRDWIQQELITRTKIRTKTLREPASMGTLDAAVKLLIKGHVLRIDVAGDREWIELSHDRLINPVLKSNEDWREKHLALVQKQAKLWSEAGKSKKELLFFGEELDEAERFAAEHPDEMGRDDQDFLQASRLERKRVEEDNLKKAQIEQKNKLLMSQRLLLIALSVLMILAACVAFYWGRDNRRMKETVAQANVDLIRSNTHLQASLENSVKLQLNLEKAKDDLEDSLACSQLLQAVAMAREGRGIEALSVVLQARKTIEQRKLDEARKKLDLSLMEIAGRLPPIILEAGRHSHIVRAVQFSSDGTVLFSGGWDEKLKIWPLEPKGKESVMDEHSTKIYSLAYHAPNQMLVSTDEAGLIIIWRVLDGQLQKLSQLTTGQSGHKRQVTGAAFNSDGTLLATASWDKLIVLWNVSDPAAPIKVASFGSLYHLAPIYRIAFLEGGTHAGKLVSSDLDGKVGLWKMPSADGSMNTHPDRAMETEEVLKKRVGIYSMAVSKSGRWLAVGDSNGDVVVWDLKAEDPKSSGKHLKPSLSHQDTVFGMAFSPSGATLVTVGSDEVLLKWDLPAAPKNVTDLEKNIRVRRVEGWGEKLYSVAFHPQRDSVVAVGGGKRVHIVDLNLLNPLTTALGGPDRIAPAWRLAVMTPDSTLISALTSDQQHIYFWRRGSEGYKPVENLAISSLSKFSGMAMHPNGNTLATLTWEGELSLWQLAETGSPTPRVLRPAAPQEKRCPQAALSFSPDGKLLGVAMGPELHLWTDSGSGGWQHSELAKLKQNHFLCIAFSPKIDLLAAAGDFGTIKVWNITDGKASPSDHESRELLQENVLALAFSPDGQRLVSGSENAFLREWELPGLRKTGESALHKRAVTSLSYGSRKGLPLIISADREGQLVGCSEEISDEQCFHIGRPQGTAINSLTASADLNQLVAAGGGLFAWNLSFEEMLKVAEHLAGIQQ
jgi:WD40 repeat protein